MVAQAHHGQDVQEATYLLPQLYAAAAVGLMFDRSLPEQPYKGPRTRYEMLPGGVEGLREGFVGRRREQQTLIPDLRSGQITVALLHGVGGQGKSTLATRVANRLAADGYRIVAVKANKRTDETPAGCAARTVQELMDELRRAFVKAGREDVLAVLQNDKLELPMRLELAVDYLREVQVLLVLDNFEDVLDLETLEIQDEALAAFYRRLTGEHLTAGSRAIVTCRYVPAGTPTAARLVRVCDTLPDFGESDFFKFLNREPAVAERMRRGDLPRSVLEKLFGLVGGTPRFLNVVRDLLKTYAVEQLGQELAGAAGLIGEAREKYLRDIFGPKLFALLGADTQRVLTHLAVSELPLPADGIAAVTELDEAQVTAALSQAVRYGLVQDFADDDGPTLFLPPGLWRPWLTADERLAADRLPAAHAALAQFWQAAYEADRERELRVSIVAELEACRHHARRGGRPALFCWASVRLARFLTRYSEFREARRVMREVPESDRDIECWHQLGRAETFLSNWREARQYYEQALAAPDDGSPEQQKERASVLANLAGIEVNEWSYAEAREKYDKSRTILQQIGDRAGEAATWHCLATIDLNEGSYADAREKFQKSLTIKQQIGDRAGEAGTWHQLATIDLNEGSYAEAREKFQKALTMRQQIGDRAGEAGTWHQLATIDLNEGSYAEAREKFQKSLTIKQQIGDRAGEAGTWHQLATIDLNEGSYAEAREKFQKALTMRQQIGDRAGEGSTWHNLATIDLREGAYAEAREKFQKSLTMRQQIGDRAGEANTWHQLATIDLNEGSYAEAREKFQKALAMRQQIGARAGEATTFYQVGMVAIKQGNPIGGARLAALSFALLQAIGHNDANVVLKNLLAMCSDLGYTEEQVQQLLAEVAESYGRDRGASLVAEAFGD